MQQLKKAHIYYPILGILLLIYTIGGVAWAINIQNDGFRVPATTVAKIEVHSECKDV